jgi:hypothetical protein
MVVLGVARPIPSLIRLIPYVSACLDTVRRRNWHGTSESRMDRGALRIGSRVGRRAKPSNGLREVLCTFVSLQLLLQLLFQTRRQTLSPLRARTKVPRD